MIHTKTLDSWEVECPHCGEMTSTFAVFDKGFEPWVCENEDCAIGTFNL